MSAQIAAHHGSSAGKRVASLASLALVAAFATAPAADVLVVPDRFGQGLDALAAGLTNRGIHVVISPVTEDFYDATNPAPTGFTAVIHLDAATRGVDMPMAGQLALVDYVRHGGTFIHAAWDAFEIASGRMQAMRELVLFDAGQMNSLGRLSLTAVMGEQGHPLLAGLPSSFDVLSAWDSGQVHVFADQPAEVVMRDARGGDALAARSFGRGHAIGMSLAVDGADGTPLGDPSIIQIYANAILWSVASSTQDTTPPTIFLAGDAAVDCALGRPFQDPGFTAIDDVDGDITAAVEVLGSVDTAHAGDYLLTYRATDASGNIGTAQRAVTVHAPPRVSCSTAIVQLGTKGGLTDVGLTWNAGTSRPLISIACRVSQDEALSDHSAQPHDGVLTYDADGSPSHLSLLNDRVAKEDGRVYLIRITVIDDLGQVGSGACCVVVPKGGSKKQLNDVLAQGAEAIAGGGALPVQTLGGMPSGNG